MAIRIRLLIEAEKSDHSWNLLAQRVDLAKERLPLLWNLPFPQIFHGNEEI
jgi:hypothetical protein